MSKLTQEKYDLTCALMKAGIEVHSGNEHLIFAAVDSYAAAQVAREEENTELMRKRKDGYIDLLKSEVSAKDAEISQLQTALNRTVKQATEAIDEVARLRQGIASIEMNHMVPMWLSDQATELLSPADGPKIGTHSHGQNHGKIGTHQEFPCNQCITSAHPMGGMVCSGLCDAATDDFHPTCNCSYTFDGKLASQCEACRNKPIIHPGDDRNPLNELADEFQNEMQHGDGDDEPVCIDCGEDEKLHYNEQYANGESWTCQVCGREFMFQRKGE